MPILIRFDPDDLAVFADASFDRNPLHLSAEYARKTPFGERVVFGILGLLKAMAGVEGRRPADLSGVTVDFRSPMFMGVDYLLEVGAPKADQVKVSIKDADRPVMTATLRYHDAGGPGRPGDRAEGRAPRSSASRLGPSDLVEGFEVVGRYAPSPGPFADLLGRCGLPACGNAGSPVAALLLLSYVVGMELPGERAVFSRLKLQLAGEPGAGIGPFDYTARVVGYHEVYDRLEIGLMIAQGGEPFASASISTAVRPDSPITRTDRVAGLLPPSDRMRGQSALVVGGSRGLGSALVTALASQGCTVWLNYRTSRDEAEALIAGLPAGYGAVRPARGDAGEEAWCREWGGKIAAEGGIDHLFCNAVPSIRPLPFALDSTARLRRFIDESVALVANPLAAFGPSVEARGGWCVVTSSSYASDTCEDLPPDLHHYVASKRAVEGLVSSLSTFLARARFLVARPPRLLTDQTNSRSARVGALAVEDVAAAIVGRLVDSVETRNFVVLEEFPPFDPS
jgi:NAD(P)-dependent dehydrogenase (short-subunit alcohol dehydrogenase family)